MKLENKVITGAGTLMAAGSETYASRFREGPGKISAEETIAHVVFFGAVVTGIAVYKIIKNYKGGRH
jgi:hypothetical protein